MFYNRNSLRPMITLDFGRIKCLPHTPNTHPPERAVDALLSLLGVRTPVARTGGDKPFLILTVYDRTVDVCYPKMGAHGAEIALLGSVQQVDTQSPDNSPLVPGGTLRQPMYSHCIWSTLRRISQQAWLLVIE